jgi:hypothetical protein
MRKRSFMRTSRILLAFLALAIPVAVFGQVGVSISIGPPALPVYEQPICPEDGDIWTPGYWAYDNSISDYYWVPGTWVMAPETGYLWTPGYWGWGNGGYLFNDGYWGPTVGFYGGINYGFGYFGEGYGGGRWDHNHFFYNSSVSHVDVSINHNVYNTVIENRNENHVSFNGGTGGVQARPNHEQEAAAKERHIPAVEAQTRHAETARATPSSRASVNHGSPAVTATSKPGAFPEHGAEATHAAEVPAEKGGAATTPRTVVHPNDLEPVAHPAPANSGNAKADKKYQQQQDKLATQQTQERQKLQQKQEAEHQQPAYKANPQKVEQKHQQQTQALSQRHSAQQQNLQSHQPQARPRK